MRWISPVEELPEDHEVVLAIYCPPNGHIDLSTDADTAWYVTNKEEGWQGWGSWVDEHDGVEPMWWMRLPPIPGTHQEIDAKLKAKKDSDTVEIRAGMSMVADDAYALVAGEVNGAAMHDALVAALKWKKRFDESGEV